MGEHTVTLVRHGETEWSRTGRHTGRTDIPLTDAGRQEAARLGAALAGRQYARVLTSPLRRARDTASIAGYPSAEVDADLREWDYGDYEGRTTADIRASDHPRWLLWDDGVPNGETLDGVARRADRVIERIRAADGDILVFAHGHFLRVLAARWLGADPAFGRHLVLRPATLSILSWERQCPALEAWNAPVG